LQADLETVIHRTLQPATLGIWIRVAALARPGRGHQRTISPSAAYLSMCAWPLCKAYSSIILTRVAPSG
jgi:hypothetical protein